MSDLVEIGAAALKECRWDARNKNNTMLEKRGLWSDHTFQPPDAEYARALFAAIEKAGHKIVPVEATPEMMAAPEGAFPEGTSESIKQSWRDVYAEHYRLMLAAAPKVTP